MNNSRVIENILDDTQTDMTPVFRRQETELIEIIEAIEAISQSRYWKVLQNKVFVGVLESLQRRLRSEKDSKELFRLQGQAVWAEKYCDFVKLADAYRKQLQNIKSNLKNYEKSNDGAFNGSRNANT